MTRFPDLFLLVLVSVGVALSAGRMAPATSTPPTAHPTGAAVVPVVVELFTSEGCSSCPAADALLRELETTAGAMPGVEVIALGQHVDYWNRLGWADPFSSAQYTARQRAYAEVLQSGTYTPQAVVGGRTELVGSQREKLTRAIAAAARAPRATVQLARTGAGASAAVTIRVTDLPAGTAPADVVLVLAESGLTTLVGRGENGGRTLAHASVVRSLRTVGDVANGGAFTATVPIAAAPAWQTARLRAVVLVQERASRRIVGVGTVPLLGEAAAN